jgi:hypothetical protein
MYAILLAVKGDHTTAELFFQGATQFCPRFFQAWISFHLFYLLNGRQEAADVTLVLGMYKKITIG